MSHTRFLIVTNLIGQAKLHNRYGDTENVAERLECLERYVFDWWKYTDNERQPGEEDTP